MSVNFELFMCCLGNGITVCNKAVCENNDYKTVAHISPAGNITYFVRAGYIPADDLERIEKAAAENRADFLVELRKLMKFDLTRAYLVMLNSLTISELIEFNKKQNGVPMRERFKALVPLYIARN